MKRVLALLILFPIFASAAQNAIVTTDGAMVYRKADFDAQVIGYMRSGQKVRISSKTFGGAFYKIQFKQGVLGYIADTDVESEGRSSSQPKSSKKDIKSKSFIGKTYLGVNVASLNFSEVFNQSSASDDLIFFGAKFTTPLKFLTGPFVLDTNFLYHQGYPSYYDTVGTRGESGRIALLDASVMYSLFESSGRSFWVYFGAGPLISYSSFVVEINSSKKDLTEVQFGGSITAGAAVKFGSLAFKFEPKYFFLETSYFGFLGSLQFEL